MRMSGAQRYTYRHRDSAHLERLLSKSTATCKIIVSDGVFSQDGDIARLPEILHLAERYDAMIYIDDAHGTGILGRHGGGICEHFNINSDRIIYMGTLSKAYGSIGGFVACAGYLTDILKLSSAAYGFTSTLPPDQAYAVSEAVDMVLDEVWRHQALWKNQKYFVARMAVLDYQLLATETPIVPILIGDELLADTIASDLREKSIHVDSVKFPAVQLSRARIRIQLNAGHTAQDIDRLVDALRYHSSYRDEKRLAAYGA
jgi:7-keto-8-aminopelargonate synthetase-like enzyme